jgi:hypothetical protein
MARGLWLFKRLRVRVFYFTCLILSLYSPALTPLGSRVSFANHDPNKFTFSEQKTYCNYSR